MTPWTWLGLAIALFGLPLVVGPLAALLGPLDATTIVLRECANFALGAALVFGILRKEGAGLASVGLGRPPLGETARWVPVATLACVVAILAAFGLVRLFQLPFGSDEASIYDTVPTAVLLLVIARAGLLEELFYRGYAISRLEALTGSRWLAAVIPLLLFAMFHYKQGSGGMLTALLTGAALTAIYLAKRNLWINVAAHFLIDFVANVVVPRLFHV